MLLLLSVSLRDERLQAKMRSTFTKLDLDSNGSLDRSELLITYELADLRPPMPSLDELIDRYDANHDGKIQFCEFEQLMKWVMSKR